MVLPSSLSPWDRVRLANERYLITQALRDVGLEIFDEVGEGRSHKHVCPFVDIDHIDPAPSLRVFTDTNHAYCYDCERYLTPTRLISLLQGREEPEVAMELLAKVGILDGTAEERFDRMLAAPEEAPNLAEYGEAFRLACARVIKPWRERQYDSDVSEWMTQMLAPLQRVTTTDEAEQWLDVVKKILAIKFGGARA